MLHSVACIRSIKGCSMVVFRDMGCSLRHLGTVDEYAKVLTAGLAAHAKQVTPGFANISTNTLSPIIPLFIYEGKSASISKQLKRAHLTNAEDRHRDCDIEGSVDDIGLFPRWRASSSTKHCRSKRHINQDNIRLQLVECCEPSSTTF
jgi:hypothetical protein